MTRSPRLSDRVRDVGSATDPVAAFLDAHEHRELVSLHTSGTGGRQRSVVRTTDSWVDSFDHVTHLLGLDSRSRVWVPGPLEATMNLFSAVHAAHVGASVQRTPDGATHATLTPAALTRSLAHGTEVTGMHVLVAGDRLGQTARDAALDRGVARVSHYYGAAELSFVAWGSHAGDLRPFPGVAVQSRDGLLWVRSPYLCRGYDGPDGPLSRGTDGFVTVGDRGVIEDGLVRVHGRGTDTVTTAGATVLVADVEQALEHATGHRVVVLGVPHPDLGQVLCAALVDPTALEAVRDAARDVLEPAHRPRRWVAVEELPLTPAGKVDRDRLAALVASSSEGVRRLR